MAVSTLEIAWLAGILEGEGCFVIGKRSKNGIDYKRTYISLVMTDKDVMDKAGRLMGYEPKPMPWRPLMRKATYRLSICGQSAIEWMMTIYSLMGERRQSKIRECIAVWKASPGKSHRRSRIWRAAEVATHR